VLVRSCVIFYETQLEAMERAQLDTMLRPVIQANLEANYKLFKEVAGDAPLPRCTFSLLQPEIANTFMGYLDRENGLAWCREFFLNRSTVAGTTSVYSISWHPRSRKPLV